MKAIELILAERGKQIAKGYTSEHDDTHVNNEINDAALAYAIPDYRIACTYWPWDHEYYKYDHSKTIDGRIKNLVKAGALIVAEIERLNRLKENEGMEA